MFRHDPKSFMNISYGIITTTPHECYKITLLWEEIHIGEMDELTLGYKSSEFQSQDLNGSLSDFTK